VNAPRVGTSFVVGVGLASASWLILTARLWMVPLAQWHLTPPLVSALIVRPPNLFVIALLYLLLLIGVGIAVGAAPRHKWLASVIGVVAAVTAFASFTPMGFWWSGEVYFQAHRDEFAALAEHFDSPAFTEDPEAREYYGAALPPLLALVSSDGRASYDGAATFVPVWQGIPGDAGGFFYSRTSPQDYDMYGLICDQPEQVAENWWACGMP